MSDWADGFDFTPPTSADPIWTSGYDVPSVNWTVAPTSTPPITQSTPTFNSIVTDVTNAGRAITSLVMARDSYQDARADRAVNRELKVLDAQTRKDLAGINSQTARYQALGGLNWAKLQSTPSQFGLGNAANDRLVLLLTAVGVVIAALQYAKKK